MLVRPSLRGIQPPQPYTVSVGNATSAPSRSARAAAAMASNVAARIKPRPSEIEGDPVALCWNLVEFESFCVSAWCRPKVTKAGEHR
jgi:hypothetical protein